VDRAIRRYYLGERCGRPSPDRKPLPTSREERMARLEGLALQLGFALGGMLDLLDDPAA
jgi:hypothetical protein